MKIRDGFVSNSSSSSFVIISRKADISEIDDERVKVSIGWGSDGEYYGRPDEEQIAWMKEHSSYINFDLYYEYFAVEDATDLSKDNAISMRELAKFFLDPESTKLRAYAKEIDYHFPSDLDRFIHLAAPDHWRDYEN